MKAMNLCLLSRAAGGDRFSKLARELTGSAYEIQYSAHEAESLRALTDGVAAVLKERAEEGEDWVCHLDGFYPEAVIPEQILPLSYFAHDLLFYLCDGDRYRI